MARLLAFNGIQFLPRKNRPPAIIHLIYVFLLPLAAMTAYDIETGDSTVWTYAFGIIAIVHLAFTLNNYKVNSSALLQWWAVLGVPIMTVLISVYQGWDAIDSVCFMYVYEVLGMCVGLFLGSIFRKAEITIKHRLLSVVLAAVFVLTVYLRFHELFQFPQDAGFIHGYGAVLIPGILASYPYARIFIGAKEDTELNMETSNLVDKLKIPLALMTLAYIFAPGVLGTLLH